MSNSLDGDDIWHATEVLRIFANFAVCEGDRLKATTDAAYALYISDHDEAIDDLCDRAMARGLDTEAIQAALCKAQERAADYQMNGNRQPAGIVQGLNGLQETAEQYTKQDLTHEFIKLRFFNEIAEFQPKPWVIKNVIAMGETSSWIAPPGKGKSSLLADIAIHLAAYPEWRGYRIKQQLGSVYFALERANLVERRLRAYSLRDGVKDLPIAVAGQIIDLMSKTCVVAIVDAIKRAEDKFACKIGLAIFDTYSKGIAAGGGDENQAKDQNIALANVRRVIDQIGIHIATIGHTGKDETRGERGSNAKLADADLQVQISGDAIKTAIITKANDQEEGELTSFKLEPYTLGIDEDGDPARIFILSKELQQAAPANRSSLSDRQKLAVDALANCGSRPAPPELQLPHSIQIVKIEDWKTEMYRRGVLDKDAINPRTDFQRLRNQLAAKSVVAERDGYCWLVHVA